jgi:hypothetical protein
VAWTRFQFPQTAGDFNSKHNSKSSAFFRAITKVVKIACFSFQFPRAVLGIMVEQTG